MLEYIVPPLVRFVGTLPLEMVRSSGRFFGRCAYRCARKGRRTALKNLQLAYGAELPAAERKRIARKSFENLVGTAFEICWARNLPGDIEKVIDPINKEACLRAHAEGKGVLLLVPHMGNWEICARWLTSKFPVVHAVARRQKEPWVQKMLERLRGEIGLHLIDNRSGLRQVLAALRRGELVIMMIDQHMRKGAVQVDFFGHPAMTTASAALLAVRTGCNVLVGACYRSEDGGWGCEFSDPVETTISGDRDRDFIVNTQRYVSLMEDFVRAHPEDWMWMHRRWRIGRQREPHRANPFLESVETASSIRRTA